ncbi:uncharacterized protein LOC100377873 [Saccoglossus kowalevskii]|uniref:Leucine-rich repeat-containing protein DDB_G0290503-like n=1 Tax=Saccoglossus kowalevskii TaxID=10224 RepID=A0ABM0GQP1_SACKO|nr:PREDICTED: putative leucine-rich repeat-containing protein DDB_G0290503-like [Saccoglossus kowalevskii]
MAYNADTQDYGYDEYYYDDGGHEIDQYPQYDNTMMSNTRGHESVSRIAYSKPSPSPGSKLPVMRRSGIPMPSSNKHSPKKTSAQTAGHKYTSTSAQFTERKIKSSPLSSPSHSSSTRLKEPKIRSPEVRDLKTPDSDGSEELITSMRYDEDQFNASRSSSSSVLDKLGVLEERMDSVATDNSLSSLDTIEKLTSLHERINQLEEQNFKILEEVTRQPDTPPAAMVNGEKDKEIQENRDLEIMEKMILLEDKLEGIMLDNKSATQNIEGVLSKMVQDMSTKMDTVKKNATEIQEKMTENIRADMENMMKQFSESGDKSKEMEIENASLRDKLSRMEDISKSLVERDETIKKLERENNALKLESTKNKEIAKDVTAKDEKLKRLEREKADLQLQVTRSQTVSKTLSEKEDKIKQLEKEAATSKSEASIKNDKLTATVGEKDNKIKELEKEITSMKSKLSTAESKIKSLTEEVKTAALKASSQQNVNQPTAEDEQSGKKKKGGKFKKLF